MNVRLLFLIAPVLIVAPATAQSADSPLTPLFECRDIPNDAERLTCLDAAVDALRGETESGEVVAVDRGQIESAEEATFGLSIPGFRLPGLPGFGNDDAETDLAVSEPEAGSPDRVVTRNDNGSIDRIENLAVAEFSLTNRDKAQIVLANGQVWRQTDGTRVQRPRSRDMDDLTVTIRSGSFGAYFLQLSNGGRWFRAERIN